MSSEPDAAHGKGRGLKPFLLRLPLLIGGRIRRLVTAKNGLLGADTLASQIRVVSRTRRQL